MGKLDPGGTAPNSTLNKSTLTDVFPLGIRNSVATPRSCDGVSAVGSYPKKLKNKSVAFRSTPELFVIVPVNTTSVPLPTVTAVLESVNVMASARATVAAIELAASKTIAHNSTFGLEL